MKIREWEEQERLAHERRGIDPKAMDIYEVQLRKGMGLDLHHMMTDCGTAPTRKEQELQLLESDGCRAAPARHRGAATWLAEGLSIEEVQLTLQMDLRKLGRHPTETQRLEIARRRDRLQRDIDRWLASGVRLLGDELGDGDILLMEQELLLLDDDSADEVADEFRLFEPEKMILPMPSILGLERCAELGAADLIPHELALRQGQANDALHNIRVHLADKAVIFRTTVRTAKSQAMSTRAWAQVHSVDRAVSINASIYSKCRAQLASLGADDELLERYRPLIKEQLKVSTAIADPNARGQRNNTLAWFWSMDVEGDSNDSDWLDECELLIVSVGGAHNSSKFTECTGSVQRH